MELFLVFFLCALLHFTSSTNPLSYCFQPVPQDSKPPVTLQGHPGKIGPIGPAGPPGPPGISAESCGKPGQIEELKKEIKSMSLLLQQQNRLIDDQRKEMQRINGIIQ